jgi:hypothetical protein
MIVRGNTARYVPATGPRDGSGHLYLMPVAPSQGVGEEATGVAQLFERLTASINATETLTRVLLARLEVDAPIDYQHLEGKPVRRLKVRYRKVGRLSPREVPFEDVDD